MNQDPISIIGSNQNPRDDSLLYSLYELEESLQIFEKDFKLWSDFDSWKNIAFQRWIFNRAIEVYKGKKLDLRCTCCEYSYVLYRNLNQCIGQKCYGIKIAYMIVKIVDEIVLAKARRDIDGTYSA
tara:strand:+ start:46 stop:423 length:378 start_codon:yes stop_codon:yes gene_type:complete